MATYTTLKDVARVIKASDRGLVRFSSGLTQVRTSNGVGFNYSEIEYDPDFAGKLRLQFLFKDEDTFDVLNVDLITNEDNIVSAGNLKTDDYISPDGLITFKAAGWVGDFKEGSKVTFEFDSHLSDNEAELYIREAEVEIDSILSASFIKFKSELVDGRYYEGPDGLENPVPPVVAVATTYLAAYYIYTDTFVSVMKEGGPDNTYAGRWKKRAEKYLENFIIAEGYHPPNAVSFPRFIDKTGVPGEGPGISGMVSNFEEWNRSAETEEIFNKQHETKTWPFTKSE